MTVRAGSAVRNEGGILFEVEKVVNHPSYNTKSIDYDISVLKLRKPQKHPSVTKLPSQGEDTSSGYTAWVTGWGSKQIAHGSERYLRGVELPVISTSDCRKYYSGERITDRMICAGIPSGGNARCILLMSH